MAPTTHTVRTLSTGATEWVSIRPDGKPVLDPGVPGAIMSASISDDGHRVLTVQSSPGHGGLFLRDRTAGTSTVLGDQAANAVLPGDGLWMVETVRCDGGPCPFRTFLTPVTLASRPVEVDQQCGFTVIDLSADARYLLGLRVGVFPTFDCPEPTGVVRWDRTTNTFVRIPTNAGFTPLASISNDGRFVATIGQDARTNVVDLETGAIQLADANSSAGPGPGQSIGGALSGNGRYVAFQTPSKLVGDDTEDHDDIYTRYAIQPGVTSAAPTSLARGATHAVVTITGTELLSGADVSFGSGITINSVNVQSPTTLTVDVSVSPTAPVGSHPIAVINTGGFGQSNGWCFDCLTIS